MVKVHMNNKLDSYIPVFVHVLCTVKVQVSSSPDTCPMVHRNEKQTCHCLSASAGVSFAISASVFAKLNSYYVMTYKRNDSLRVSTGPGIAFESC